MHVVLAFDKFKDALSAEEAGAVVARALRARYADWTFDVCPLTDGGEGFAEILTKAAGGKMQSVKVTGPGGAVVTARYGLVAARRIPAAALAMLNLPALPAKARIAVVEMAQASGLALLPADQRDPWRTTTRGTGQIIQAAMDAGARAIVLGVGGSATHDLGLGALSALGFQFRQSNSRILRSVAPTAWARLARVTRRRGPEIPPIRIACDVANPLLGPRGAAKIYAPQKGLRSADYLRLEHESARIAALLMKVCAAPAHLCDVPGTGAAGGLAFGLICALGAELLPGFALVAAWLKVEARLSAADIVVTGEGRFDESSFAGKGPGSIAQRALAMGKPVHVFAGRIDPLPMRAGLKLHPITPPGHGLPEALRNTARNLAAAAARWAASNKAQK
jgi:glycerate kinase